MQSVTLNTIGGGALAELFARELATVLANIADINTDAKAKRKITLDVIFAPGEKRDTADVSLKCKATLAGINTVKSHLFMGKHNGKLVAVENDPRQGGLFDPESKPLAAVTPFQQPDKDGDQ